MKGFLLATPSQSSCGLYPSLFLKKIFIEDVTYIASNSVIDLHDSVIFF